MPITNGKYVAPTWSNGGGTPLSAANLQDISDALAFSGRIVTGSYTGTGTYGGNSSTGPNTTKLTFPFQPTFIFIRGGFGYEIMTGITTNSYPRFLEYTKGYGISNGGSALNGNRIEYSWSGNNLYIFSELNADSQMNTKGTNYFYVAIG